MEESVSQCPICGSENLVEKEELHGRLKVPIKYTVCLGCEAELVFPEQMKYNSRSVRNSKKKGD